MDQRMWNAMADAVGPGNRSGEPNTSSRITKPIWDAMVDAVSPSSQRENPAKKENQRVKPAKVDAASPSDRQEESSADGKPEAKSRSRKGVPNKARPDDWEEDRDEKTKEICRMWGIENLEAIFETHPTTCPRTWQWPTVKSLYEVAQIITLDNAREMIQEQIAKRVARRQASNSDVRKTLQQTDLITVLKILKPKKLGAFVQDEKPEDDEDKEDSDLSEFIAEFDVDKAEAKKLESYLFYLPDSELPESLLRSKDYDDDDDEDDMTTSQTSRPAGTFTAANKTGTRPSRLRRQVRFSPET